MPEQETAVHEHAAVETDDWIENAVEELPPRPRRRLLGAGGNPIPLALLGVLLIACGFIAGVLVEKGQTSPSSTGSGGGAAGLAARFAALRGASGAGSGTSAGSSGGSPVGGFAASGSGATGRGTTIGQVAYIDGSTLYVTNTEGNTVKVKTSAASTVTKTVKANVKGIRPGETIAITGATGASGTVDAESIRIGGGAGAGLGALFSGSGRGSSGGSEPALFGKGG